MQIWLFELKLLTVQDGPRGIARRVFQRIRLWQMAPDILIALGGNLPFGDHLPQDTIALALAALPLRGLTVRAASGLYKTPCFPVGAGPDYVNAAAVLADDQGRDAAGILAALHAVEAEFGRQRDRRWAGRTLDLDLLAWGDSVLPDLATFCLWRDLPAEAQAQRAPLELILPHPRLQDRAFVLVPLMDVAPDWHHPVLGRSIAQLCADLPAADRTAVVVAQL